MYQIQFVTTDSEDWTEAIELIDSDTNLPLEDADTATFELAVRDGQHCLLFSGSTDDGRITKPASNIIQWAFTKAEMQARCVGSTYLVGCTMTTPYGTIQIFTGTLAYIEGVVA